MTDPKPEIEPEKATAFLEEAARYFSKLPDNGEDRAYWANVYNADNCRRISSLVSSLLADRARMEKALREAEEVLAMAALMPMVDPVHGDEVEALGLRIGFGALMSSAQASWRQQADVKGGEFVAGPCFATVIETLKTIRQALGASQ